MKIKRFDFETHGCVLSIAATDALGPIPEMIRALLKKKSDQFLDPIWFHEWSCSDQS